MTVNLNVTIKNSGPNSGYLDVDESGNANHIPKGAQSITWKLTGNANGGTINSVTWLVSTPSGMFGNPVPQQNGNMTMSDNNTISGSWAYQLVATIDGRQYSTNSALGPTATTTNPTIKNE